MNTNNIPTAPKNSFRIVLDLAYPESRMDKILLTAIREQNENIKLKGISRTALKELFGKGKIVIKRQRATPSSALAKGTTYVDILS